MENEVLKVVCGSFVMMKKIRHRKLYPLLDTTVIGDLEVGINGSKYQKEHAQGYGTYILSIYHKKSLLPPSG